MPKDASDPAERSASTVSRRGEGPPANRGDAAPRCVGTHDPRSDPYDVVVVGAGPAGMAAALGAREGGAERVLIVDREPEAGGILPQCIHAGFGLLQFKEELTGPEYAQRYRDRLREANVELLTNATALDVDDAGSPLVLSPRDGLRRVPAGAVVLALGARERTRASARIAGTRPAGVMTAGLAQKLVNVAGYLPGERVVILGSGDIGLIMARRMVLEGAEVIGVFELMPYANGLARNVAQCLDDFDVPLHLSTTVTEIHGHDRVEAVTVAPVDADGRVRGPTRRVACDTVLLSVGLRPDDALPRRLGLRLDPATGGPVVHGEMATSRAGVFACGNGLHVHDVVDYVSREAQDAGRAAAAFASGTRPARSDVRVCAGENVRYCVPQALAPDAEQTLYLRVTRPMEEATVHFGALYEKPLRYAVPGEMISLRLRPRVFEGFEGACVTVDVRPREGAAS